MYGTKQYTVLQYINSRGHAVWCGDIQYTVYVCGYTVWLHLHAQISCRLCWSERGGAELDTNVVLNPRTGWDHQEFSLREIELKVTFRYPF